MLVELSFLRCLILYSLWLFHVVLPWFLETNSLSDRLWHLSTRDDDDEAVTRLLSRCVYYLCRKGCCCARAILMKQSLGCLKTCMFDKTVFSVVLPSDTISCVFFLPLYFFPILTFTWIGRLFWVSFIGLRCGLVLLLWDEKTKYTLIGIAVWVFTLMELFYLMHAFLPFIYYYLA